MNRILFSTWIFGNVLLIQFGQSNETFNTTMNSARRKIIEVRNEDGRMLLLSVAPKTLETYVTRLQIYDGQYQQPIILQRSNLCHMTGYVLNGTLSYVSLDICEDVSGVVFDGKKIYEVKSGKAFLVKTFKDVEFKDNQGQMSCMHLPRRQYDINIKKENYGRVRRSASETLMIEMYVVMDSELFSETSIGKNRTRALQYVEKMTQKVDEIYSDIGVRVLLVGVEIWQAPQPSVPASDGTELLDQFLEFTQRSIRQTSSVEFDMAVLISGKKFGQNHVGMAHVNAMCGDQSGVIVQDDETSMPRELKTAVILAHEIGHVFGMLHDDASCTCDDPKDCVMAADITQLPQKFSSCSAQTIKKVKDTGRAPCLYNVPETIYNGPICGNGIKEYGEVCDCGGPKKCKQSQCCTDMCQLKHGAKCDTGGCCHECQITKANKLCRPSQNDCDLDEVCNGKSENCPANLYKQDLIRCGQGIEMGYCYKGQCHTNTLQCRAIWGPSGKSADGKCYTLNTAGSSGGSCGSVSHNTYKKCNQSDIMCGMLFCDSTTQNPIIGGGTQTVNSMNFGSVTCKGVSLDLGPDIPDPGLVDDGSPCYSNTSAKFEGICISQRCIELSKIPVKRCPTNNGTTCSGKGICNNLGSCWCFHGFTGIDCSVIISSGGLTPEGSLTDVHIILISVGSGVLVSLCGVIIIICYKKRSKEKIKNHDKHKKDKHEVNDKLKAAWSDPSGKDKNKKTTTVRTTKVQSIAPVSTTLRTTKVQTIASVST